MKKIIGKLIAAAVMGALALIANATPEQVDKEVQGYVSAFNSGAYAQMKDALGELDWKGISDSRIYDAMVEQFNKSKANTDKVSLDQTAHLARGLAMSGNDKYKAVIQAELAGEPHKKLVKHYNTALEEFAYYAKLNAIASANLDKAADIQVQRVKNFLSSDDPEIMVIGAKRVYNAHYSDKELLELAAKRLNDTFTTANDRSSIDAAANICKALAKSGMSQYKELLTKVADTAPNEKLKKYAAKYAAEL